MALWRTLTVISLVLQLEQESHIQQESAANDFASHLFSFAIKNIFRQLLLPFPPPPYPALSPSALQSMMHAPI